MTDQPFTMRLCGHDVPVNFTDPGNWCDKGMGRCNSLRGEIELATSLTDVTRPATFLHEMIHLILDFHGHGGVSCQEPVVDALSCGLLAWMKDNPELVDQISRGTSIPVQL